MAHKTLLGGVLALAALAAQADTLLIENVRQAEQAQTRLPESGATMETVESQFGAPNERRPAVGEPPIARWQYEDFVVYFEHDRVIHAVVRRQDSEQ